jgi:chitin disaccharide deacetylase
MDAAQRTIVLHADDFGMNPAVTDGILEGFAEGLLTSTSLLANAPDASRALDLWKCLEQDRRDGKLKSAGTRRRLSDADQPFDLGVHLNLTQGCPLTADCYPDSLLDQQGRFPGISGLFRRLWFQDAKFRAPIENELSQQVQFLLDRGLRPTHLNGHQYVEMVPAVTGAVLAVLEKFRLNAIRVACEWPGFRVRRSRLGSMRANLLASVHQHYARRFQDRIAGLSVAHPDVFLGIGRAGRVDLNYLRSALAARSGFRLVEVCLHPAVVPAASPDAGSADGWHDPLATVRPGELSMLLSDELADFLESGHLPLGRVVPSAYTLPHPRRTTEFLSVH